MTDVFTAPTIGQGRFQKVLTDAKSPVLAERPAGQFYQVCVSEGVDPAFMLAVFGQESNYGTDPQAVVNRYGTKNWGNTRSVADPLMMTRVQAPTVIQTDRGQFVKYPQWIDSLRDACWRIQSGAFPYRKAGAMTVESIIPIWSPNGDQDNNAAAYVAAVVARMTAWREGETVAQYCDSVQIIPHAGPGQNDNRDGRKLSGFHAFVVHETDNEAPTATAQMHHDWLIASRPDASFQVVADATQSIQLLPMAPGQAEVAWHIGDGVDQADDEGLFTIGGEICVNSKAGFPAACRRMARVAAAVLNDYGKAVVDGVTLRTHGSYWSARNPGVHQGCPRHLKAGDWGVTWPQFVAMVKAEWDALQTVKAQEAVVKPAPAPAQNVPAALNPLYFPLTGQYLDPRFWSFFSQNGAMLRFGMPLEGSHQDRDGVVRQLLENVLLEAWPDGNVRLGGLGQLYKAKG